MKKRQNQILLSSALVAVLALGGFTLWQSQMPDTSFEASERGSQVKTLAGTDASAAASSTTGSSTDLSPQASTTELLADSRTADTPEVRSEHPAAKEPRAQTPGEEATPIETDEETENTSEAANTGEQDQEQSTSSETSALSTDWLARAETIAPQNLAIEKIGVSTDVEYVGINDKGDMAAPEDYRNVSWYGPGYLPGEKGNAVFAGHHDWKGNQGVFWDIEKLSAGDKVTVTGAGGRKLTYRVTKSQKLDYQSDAGAVFGTQGHSQIKLITCDGNFSEHEDTYEDRLVVTARLVSAT